MNTYAIVDLEGYCNALRLQVGEEMDAKIPKEIDQYITMKQVESLIEERCLGHNEYGHLMINEEIHNNVCDSISERIQNVGLAKLAADNVLECAWDDTINEMVFWLAENETA